MKPWKLLSNGWKKFIIIILERKKEELGLGGNIADDNNSKFFKWGLLIRISIVSYIFFYHKHLLINKRTLCLFNYTNSEKYYLIKKMSKLSQLALQ